MQDRCTGKCPATGAGNLEKRQPQQKGGEGDLKQLEAAQGTAAARLFLTQMVTHHQGAIMMAQTDMSQGKNADSIQLSKDIVTAQEAEIKEMQDLLAAL